MQLWSVQNIFIQRSYTALYCNLLYNKSESLKDELVSIKYQSLTYLPTIWKRCKRLYRMLDLGKFDCLWNFASFIGIPWVRSTLITDNATVRSFGQFSISISKATLNFGNVKSFETSPVIGIGCWKSSILWLIDLTINIKHHPKKSNLEIKFTLNNCGPLCLYNCQLTVMPFITPALCQNSSEFTGRYSSCSRADKMSAVS